jgi:hypothetical protein
MEWPVSAFPAGEKALEIKKIANQQSKRLALGKRTWDKNAK